MRYVLRHLFLSIGILTLVLFFVVAGSEGSVPALAVLMRILIVPIYLVWILIAMAQVALAGPHGLPEPFARIVQILGFVLGLAPYVLVDYILERRRRNSKRRRD